MSQKKKIGFFSKTAMVLGTMLSVIVLSSCHKEEEGPEIRVVVNGNNLAIPRPYFAYWGGYPRQGQEVRALNLEVIWPSMAPFIDARDDSPVVSRYREKLGILLGPTLTLRAQDHFDGMRNISNDWLRSHVTSGEEYGLNKFVNPKVSTSKNWIAINQNEDLYLPSSSAEIATLITCTPDVAVEEPVPGRNQKIIPYCHQIFFMPGMTLSITIFYRRIYLKDWKAIQDGVVSLLQSFARTENDAK